MYGKIDGNNNTGKTKLFMVSHGAFGTEQYEGQFFLRALGEKWVSMESVLVMGGAGFIGSNITEALLAKGYSVVVFDDLRDSVGDIEHAERRPCFKKEFNLTQGLAESADWYCVRKAKQCTP
jgi:GDP-mannose 4,6 dehydratase